ncbi:shikimate kinase [bacterium]|nr:shikimate kinase [Treponema sp.]MBO5384769.1 shikimate kinase [bacterium]
MKTIILTGMMGAGKTTIAHILGEKLNIKSIDIDTLIEQNEGEKISEIFSNKGEEFFRKIEKETIRNIFTPNPENLVISLGGGALENPETREFLLNNSTVIYLKTSPKIIYERIKNNTSRPLLCDNMSVEKITEILEKREANYQSATITITTDNKTPNQIAEEIIGVL